MAAVVLVAQVENNKGGAGIRSFFNTLKVENLTIDKNCDIIIV